MGAICLGWGIVSLVGMAIGMIPCVGWYNWINVPLAVIGAVVSANSMNSAPERDRGAAKAGLICCAVAIGWGCLRLLFGGGVF